MIHTVTLNPSFDRTLFVDDFRVGGTYKAVRSDLLPAGKGITLEDIRDRIADIKKLEGAQALGQANDQVARIISALSAAG